MLYEKIQSLCKKHGISIPKLEDELGFGGGTISKWKTSSPGSDKLAKIAQYFCVSTDYLLGLNSDGQKLDIDEPLDKEIESAILADDGLRKLVTIYLSLNSDNRSKWIELGRLYLNDQSNIEEKK